VQRATIVASKSSTFSQQINLSSWRDTASNPTRPAGLAGLTAWRTAPTAAGFSYSRDDDVTLWHRTVSMQ